MYVKDVRAWEANNIAVAICSRPDADHALLVARLAHVGCGHLDTLDVRRALTRWCRHVGWLQRRGRRVRVPNRALLVNNKMYG